MKAAICREFGAPLSVEEVSLAAPGHGEVHVKLKAVAICHSDIVFAEGGWGGRMPAVYGHEASGEVVGCGPGVNAYSEGDRVLVTLIRSCGTCRCCCAGEHGLCDTRFDLDRNSPLTDASGARLAQGLRTGAFAEEVVVHQSQLAKIPDDIPFDSASLLACGVITGFGAVVNTANMPVGAHAVIIGCGGVGMNAIQGAHIGGARSVIAVDISDEKVAAAKKFGATHGLNLTKTEAADEVMKITDKQGADFVFVTVGAKPAIESAFKYVGKMGKVVLVGIPEDGVTAQFDPVTMAAWGQHMMGSKMGSTQLARDIPYLVSLYQSGRLKLDELITGRYSLDQINEAIASTKKGEALRNVIVFD